MTTATTETLFINHHVAGTLANMACRAPSIQPLKNAPAGLQELFQALCTATACRTPIAVPTRDIKRLIRLAGEYDRSVDESDFSDSSAAGRLLQAQRAMYTTLAMVVGMDDFLA